MHRRWHSLDQSLRCTYLRQGALGRLGQPNPKFTVLGHAPDTAVTFLVAMTRSAHRFTLPGTPDDFSTRLVDYHIRKIHSNEYRLLWPTAIHQTAHVQSICGRVVVQSRVAYTNDQTNGHYTLCHLGQHGTCLPNSSGCLKHSERGLAGGIPLLGAARAGFDFLFVARRDESRDRSNVGLGILELESRSYCRN